MSSRLGIRSKAPITANELHLPYPRQTGGLVLVGSYVPKTTTQVDTLINRSKENGKDLAIVEIKVEELLESHESALRTVQNIVKETEKYLQAGKDTLVMTSRKLVTGDDKLSSLAIGTTVAEAVVRVLQGIEVHPRYIIAKVCLLFLLSSEFSFTGC